MGIPRTAPTVTAAVPDPTVKLELRPYLVGRRLLCPARERQNIERYMRFRDRMKVGADGQNRLRVVTGLGGGKG